MNQGSSMPVFRSKSARRFVFLALFTTAVILLVPAYFARQWAVNMENRIHDFEIAMHGLRTWDQCRGRLPDATYCGPTGSEYYSWRLTIFPYIESHSFAHEVAWDDIRNKTLADHPYSVFCSTLKRWERPTTETTMFAVTGPETAFDTEEPHRLADLPDDLVVLLEVAHSGTHWMAPGDLDVRAIPPSITKGTNGRGVMIAFADRNVWFVSSSVPVDDLRRFFTISGAERHDRETVLGPYRLGKSLSRDHSQ